MKTRDTGPARRAGWFRRRRLPGRLGPVGVSRLLVFQAIQVGLFVVLVQGIWAAVLGGLVGLLAIVVTFGRWRGRWLTETAGLWLRFRARRGTVASQRSDPRLATLNELVPDLMVEDVPGGGAGVDTLGMGSDGAGWFAVVAVEPGEAGVDPPVPMPALNRIAADAGVAGVVMQVVSQASPAVGEPVNGGAVPGTGRHRQLWVAVRLDADALARSSVDNPDEIVDVPVFLAELVRRVRRALRRRGLGSRALDADALIDALIYSCDLSGTHPGAPGRQIREEWQAWHSPRLAHRCFWLRTWPDPDQGTTLLARLVELPQALVSVALLLEPRYEANEADLRCLVRVATAPERLPAVCESVEQMAVGLGGRLAPLDGEHALAVYSSAPSGGGAR